MAGEVEREFKVAAFRANGTPAVWDSFAPSAGKTSEEGWKFPSGGTGEVRVHLPRVPQEVHATTPNPKLRIQWVTDQAAANAVKFFVDLKVVAVDSGSYNYATYDLSTTTTDTNQGAHQDHQVDVDISALSFVNGDRIDGVIKRVDGDAGDTLSGDVIVPSLIFVADKA